MLSRYDEDSRTNNRMPSGVDMTVGELQQMAARQQRQIEAQQQALVAKEQRLKYLKQQELRKQQLANENERLRQLRERVETQEQKLKRLRALRDEVTERRNSGTNLMSELESIKALFNDKEKELAMAVTKVETLSQQLDSLQKADAGAMTTNKTQTPIIIELEKLRNELRIRNELNEQQNNKLRQQRDSLGSRRQQVIDMDKRIEELQARLNKKRALQSERQRGDNEAGRSNVAAVAPFTDSSGDNTFSSQDTKYQTLPRGIKLHSVDNRQLDKYILEVNCREGRSQKEAVSQAPDVKSVSSPTSSASFTSHVMSQSGLRQGSNIGMFTARPFGSTYSAVSSRTPPQSSVNWPKTSTPITSASVVAPEKEIFITTAPASTSATVSVSKTYAPLTVSLPQGVTVQNAKTVSPVYQMATSRLQPPSQPQLAQDPPSPSMSPTVITSSHDLQVTPPVSWGPGGSPVVTDRLPAQPPSPGQFAVTNSTKVTLSDRLKSKVPLPSTFEEAGASSQTYTVAATSTPAITSEILPASNPKSKLRALIESTRPVSDSSLEPTKKSMSVSSALSVLMSSSSLSPSRGATGKPTYRYAPKSVIQNTYTRKLGSSALDNYHKNMSQLYRGFNVLAPGGSDLPSPATNDAKDMSSTGTDIPAVSSPVAKVSPVSSQPSPVSTDELTSGGRRPEMSPAVPCSPSRSPCVPVGTSPQEKTSEVYHGEEVPLEGSPPRISHMQRLCRRNSLIEATTSFSSLDPQQEEVAESPLTAPAVVVRRRKGNLKNKDSVKSSRRVSFDPLALLLDASLEGELELVMRTAKQVTDPSASNDEGITALHNAICAGHYDIVRFLVEYGCDINAPDSDGWTPLHCAASCNNLAMVKFLVEHGACVFATTISDHETAAEKCEEDEDGFDGCSEYLYSIQEKLGVINRGIVYAVFDFVAQNPDELCFDCSDKLVVLRKGDDREKEWWWAQMGPREGYMPRNLIGLFPRVVPQFSGPSQDGDE